MEDITKKWDLGKRWIQTSTSLPTLSERAHSDSQDGEFFYLTTSIGGGGVVADDPGRDMEDRYILIGCFVGKELKPRFVGSINPHEGITIWLNEDDVELLESDGYVDEIWFRGGTIGLKARLWKIEHGSQGI